jgi:hypothetical protein
MSQNRRPPAYQEYAAKILAQFPFRTMSLQDRGLFYTMRLECWVNKQLPSSPEKIAKSFGLTVAEVTASLPSVMPFFKIKGDFIVCPELENYREHLDIVRQKKSTGGVNSAAKRANGKRNKSIKSEDNDLSNNLQDTCSNLESNQQDSFKTLVKSSTVKLSQVQSSKEKDSSADSFVKEMEEYEASENDANEMVEF